MPNADDGAIVARWLGGQNANGISRSLKVPPRVREAIGRYAATAIPLDRQVSVGRQLGRLDLMLETVLPLAGSGNFKAITAACKLIGQQNLILGHQSASGRPLPRCLLKMPNKPRLISNKLKTQPKTRDALA